ncbi:transcriptional regulator Kaiso [Pseudophryne corroboree]|uniref:transcriptional regulator Kaiso n=1 Tax=Pseudophryne corroboree TaxID=495146 RepID=UPI0030819379
MEAKKLITATDTQYSGSLLQALNDQRLQGLYCDVTVIIEDRKFRAHKNILSACSTYFHQLFSVAGPVVELNFIRAEIFAEILNYIYSAKIVRVKCDMLEELIKSGKLLGVPFIAELGIPLSQVKSISGGVKENSPDAQPNTDQKAREPAKNTAPPTSSSAVPKAGNSAMPVISEAFSLSSSKESKTEIEDSMADESDDKSDDESDDDVIFCSETVQAKPVTSEKKESVQPPAVSANDQVPDAKKATPPSQPQQFIQNTKPQSQSPLKNIAPAPKVTAPVAPDDTNSNLPSPNPPANGSFAPSAPQVPVTAIVPVQHSQNASSSAATIPVQKNVPPVVNQNLPKLQPIGIVQPKTELILDGNCMSTPVSSVISLGQHTITHKNVSFDGVQKKQVVTFSHGSSSKPGEFKIKIADVNSGSSKESHLSSEPRRIMDGKKIITLDTASEIEGLSTGCKVYANIGEDTYDIVIPIKEEDEEEGLVKLDEDGFPNRKRMKLKHDDHYELIVDGRVYYICIVCKRSYVCLTSLRRHFNVHSWEKKYPCRYCERVFPLAEYRTKHEIHHTGERRYQCLTCGSSFINYQVMASHIRSVHSMDPAGDSKLYRLNPCKTLQIRQYAYISDNTNNVPVINDGGIVYDIDPDKSEPASAENNNSNDGPKPVNWDDIFLQQSSQNMFKPTTSEGSTEFEFVIPESY